MKAFKKVCSLAIASALVISLAGCGDKVETKKFNANFNGTDITITYSYKGDQVVKQASETKFNYASIGASNKDEAAKVIEPLSAKYKNIAGVEEKLTYSDTYAQENVTIDFEKIDTKTLQTISGVKLRNESEKKITIQEMQSVMEAAGFKEVK